MNIVNSRIRPFSRARPGGRAVGAFLLSIVAAFAFSLAAS